MKDTLREALADPGFTPARRQVPGVLELLVDPELERAALRALVSSGASAGRAALERLPSAPPPLRRALYRLLGRLLQSDSGAAWLEALGHGLADPDPRAAREAARALGKSGIADAEEPLLARLRDADDALRPHLVEALGKTGGQRARAALASLNGSEMAPVLARARLQVDRTVERARPSELELDAPLDAPASWELSCRRGLARWLVEEVTERGFSVEASGPAFVRVRHSGPLRALLEVRTALDVALVTPLVRRGTLVEDVVATLETPSLLGALTRLTRGDVRFRLAFAGAGHQRRATWAVAEALAARNSVLRNDPRGAPWQLVVDARGAPRLLAHPAPASDLRFSYRVADVPASSHPTVAATLVRVAGATPDDVVWDPFVGSGLELIERARLGRYRELHGTDLEARAIAAATQNLSAAGVRAALVQGDARSHHVPGLSLVVTNPPLGRRVAREKGLATLLESVIARVGRDLQPGGRMVWLSPFPDATAEAARAAGLRVERLAPVDLGGIPVELQKFTAGFKPDLRRRR